MPMLSVRVTVCCDDVVVFFCKRQVPARVASHTLPFAREALLCDFCVQRCCAKAQANEIVPKKATLGCKWMRPRDGWRVPAQIALVYISWKRGVLKWAPDFGIRVQMCGHLPRTTLGPTGEAGLKCEDLRI